VTLASGANQQVDTIEIANNVFTRCLGSSVISFASTGAFSVTNSNVHGNSFTDCPGIAIQHLGGAAGVGDNNWIVANKFRTCATTSSLIKWVDDGSTTGHRVAMNDAPKGANTNFMDIGAVATAEIKVRGNNVDGYGAGDLSLIGTNAAAVEAAQAAFNWTD
jgi:hypothetical protein